MQYDDRIRIARKQLYAYYADKEAIESFIEAATRQTQKMDAEFVRGTYRSDPTARGGIMLADPPAAIRAKVEWVKTIEDAWAELHFEDHAYRRVPEHGKAYVMEQFFCLTLPPRRKELNEEARDKLCAECGISVRTFYNWLTQITQCVIQHATRRGLL
jgi:AcrR family transcriptional regulator